MVTGDSHMTAIAVAKGVGMVSPDAQLVVIQSKAELERTACTSSYTDPAAETPRSFRHTSHPLLHPDLDPSFASKPGCRESSFTGQPDSKGSGLTSKQDGRNPSFTSRGSRNPSFTRRGSGNPSFTSRGSRNPSFTNRASCDPIRAPLSVSAQAVSRSLLLAESNDLLPPFRWKGLSRVHPTPASVTQNAVKLETFSAASVPASALIPPTPHGLGEAADTPTETAELAHSAEVVSIRELQAESCEGLVFMLQSEDGVQKLDAHHALTSIAQVDSTTLNGPFGLR